MFKFIVALIVCFIYTLVVYTLLRSKRVHNTEKIDVSEKGHGGRSEDT